MEFFSFQISYAKLLSKDFLYNIDTESFRSVSNMGSCCCCSISREYSSRAIKVILPKIVFDFTVGRLSKNVKVPCRGSVTFVCNKGTQGDGLQNRNIYHICIFDH